MINIFVILEYIKMENMYYFSQGRLIHNIPYKKFVDPTGMNEAKEAKEEKDIHSVNSKKKDNRYNIFNFQIFYPIRLRYKYYL